jgi:hypothetical protein
MDEYFCRTCGYHDKEHPFYIAPPRLHPTHNICPCCFSQAGYDDGKEFREDWLKKGAPFYEEKLKPKNWSYEIALLQIKNIPEKYLDQTSEFF